MRRNTTTETTAPHPRRVVLAERAAWVLLILNALDFLASRDQVLKHKSYAMASPGWYWLQVALVGVFCLALIWRARRIVGALRLLPIPRAAAVVCGGALVVQCAHIALHQEVFPFSHVGMFNHIMDGSKEYTVGDVYVVPGERAPVSIYREGDPLFSGPGAIDSRLSWAHQAHRAAHPVREQLAEAARERGKPAPKRSSVRFSVSDGRVVEVEAKE